MSIKKFIDIKNILYINLEHRKDRKEHMEKELLKVNLSVTRFDAIKNKNGAMGCTLSHIGCLEIAIKNKYDHILILEDDVLFTNPELLISQFDKFIETHEHWDVILLGGNNGDKYTKKDDTSIKIQGVMSAVAYLVNGHYMEKLLENYKNSIIANKPLDLEWFELQKKDDWYLILPLTVNQLISYSDIEKKNVDYTYLMLNLKH